MAEQGILHVVLVSATREVWSGQATLVVAKTSEGQLGLMAGHQPVLATLASGEVRITLPTGDKITANADGGFLSMEHNTVELVAGAASLV